MAKASTDIVEGKSIRASEVRQQLIDQRKQIEDSYVHMAQLLLEAYENAYFIRWGFERFEDYVNEELGLHYRKANYLVGIAKVVKDMKLSWADVEGVGWTKMKTLIPILKEQGSVGDWLEIATQYTVRELEEMVKDSKIGSSISTTGGKEQIVTLTFNMEKDQSDIVLEALDTAKEAIDSKDPVDALEEICYNYVMQSDAAPKRLSLENLVEYAFQQFGVALVIDADESLDINEIVEEEETPEPKKQKRTASMK